MKQTLKDSLSFLLPYLIGLLVGAIVLVYIEKGDLVLWFNAHRNFYSTIFFSISTKFAEYGFILFFIAVLLNKSFGKAFQLALIWGVSGLFVNVLKHVLNFPRPAAYFNQEILNPIEGFTLHHSYSFPSGHTTSAFAIFFALALFTKSKIWQFVFFLMALATAISRVYLLQHFFVDIYVGSILGISISLLLFVSIDSSNIFGFQNWKNKRLGKKKLF